MKWKKSVGCVLLAFALLVAGASSALAAPVQVLPSNDEVNFAERQGDFRKRAVSAAECVDL